jgi:rare lipoprotein A
MAPPASICARHTGRNLPRGFLAPSNIVAALALLLALAPIAHAQSGLASVYSDVETASGERASDEGLTAAHRSLPFGTRVLVTNLNNGRTVVVRINDRGPFIAGRVIDVTPAAARALGFSGLVPVTIAVLDALG